MHNRPRTKLALSSSVRPLSGRSHVRRQWASLKPSDFQGCTFTVQTNTRRRKPAHSKPCTGEHSWLHNTMNYTKKPRFGPYTFQHTLSWSWKKLWWNGHIMDRYFWSGFLCVLWIIAWSRAVVLYACDVYCAVWLGTYTRLHNLWTFAWTISKVNRTQWCNVVI